MYFSCFKILKAQWISPEIHSEVMWDYNILEESGEKRLAKKALRQALTKSEEMRLIEALKNDPELAFEWSFTPEVFPYLVESCTELAFQILFKLNHHPTIHQYYYQLANMPISKRVVTIMLMARETLEVHPYYVEALILQEIERQIKANRNDPVFLNM